MTGVKQNHMSNNFIAAYFKYTTMTSLQKLEIKPECHINKGIESLILNYFEYVVSFF